MQLALESEDKGRAAAHDQLKLLYHNQFGPLMLYERKWQATNRGLVSDPHFWCHAIHDVHTMLRWTSDSQVEYLAIHCSIPGSEAPQSC